MPLARIAGLVYVITFASGTMSLFVPRSRPLTDLLGATSYIVVTVLFYFLFAPTSRRLSLLAAAISLTGCAWSLLAALKAVPGTINPLIFFGVYCLLIGYLVFHSTYLPKAIGILMMIGGIGWLTFAVPSLATQLTPYNFAPGMIGEGVLTLWLVAFGVNVTRWNAMRAKAS